MKTASSFKLSALALSLASWSAIAADLPNTKGPPPALASAPLWSGVYTGLNIGGGWSTTGNFGNNFNENGFNAGVSNRLPSGAIGGGQVGYNYHISPLLVTGIEADFQGTTMGSGSSVNNLAFYSNRWGYSMGTAMNWYGTVRGRAGVAILPALLVYGTGGFVYGYVSRNGIVPNGSTQTGWTAGGGVEWMFLQNWSAKAEYLYSSMTGGPTSLWGFYPSLPNPLQISVNNQSGWNTIRAGVNYHFALGATTSITGAPIATPNYDAASLALPSLKLNTSQDTAQQSSQAAPKASYTPPSNAVIGLNQAVTPVVQTTTNLTPATGTLPEISFSDIIHP